MFCSLKRSKGGLFLGLGLGIFGALFVPLKIWLILISIILIISGLKLIFCKKARR